jgi:hypothetical protein
MEDQPASGFTTYERAWHIGGAGTDLVERRESFKRLARRAVVDLGSKFSNPDEAVDAWLNRLHEFHRGRQTGGLDARDDWAIRDLFKASAKCCDELSTRFHEAGKTDAERTFADLKQQFSEPLDPPADLYAIHRGIEGTRNQGTRRGYRSEIRAFMKTKELPTLPATAKFLGVGTDTLKNIMSSRGELRCSDATLQDVLKKIGYTGT